MTEALRALEHDVAKYILRTARNLPEGAPVPESLRPLLLRDLFGRGGEAGPAERFEEHAGALEPEVREACRVDFVGLGALRAAVEEGDEDATRKALEFARSVAQRIRRAAEQSR